MRFPGRVEGVIRVTPTPGNAPLRRRSEAKVRSGPSADPDSETSNAKRAPSPVTVPAGSSPARDATDARNADVARVEAVARARSKSLDGNRTDRVASDAPPATDRAWLNSLRPDVQPEYPPISRRRGEEGNVTLRVKIREDGSVTAVELQRSSGFTRLDESAVSSVSRARFLRPDGSPPQRVVEKTFTLVFRLNDPS